MVCEPVLVTDRTSTGHDSNQYCSLWRPVLLHFALLESPLWIGGWEGGLLLAPARGVELGGYARIRGVFTIFDHGVARLRSGSTPLVHYIYRQVETMAEQETPQFNIELPEEVGQGQYANLAVVLHSQSEFILDFVRLLPGQQSARVHSRQILTPDNAKRLVRLLEQHLAGFEQEYGKIELPEDGAVEVNAN